MQTNGEERERARSLLIHHLLGQLSESEDRWLTEQLRSSESLRAECSALESTVATLREARSLQPSARFRVALERRLDRIDSEHSAARPQGARRNRNGWRFRWHLLGHRLRTSPRLQVQLAASLFPLFIGLGWLFSTTNSADPSAEVETASWDPEVGPIDQSKRTSGEMVDHQTVSNLEDLPPVVPDFVDMTPSTEPVELPEPGSMVDRSPFENPIPVLPTPDGDLPVGPRNDQTVDPAWEVPVRRALRWMLAQQLPDGSWSSQDGEADLGVTVTAVSVLAFVSDGHLGLRHGADDPLGVDRAVRAGVASLLARQDQRVFGRTRDFATETFNHATATLALSEHVSLALAAGATDEQVAVERRAVIEGLDVLEARLRRLFRPGESLQDRRDRRGQGENAAWAAQALASARRSGLNWGMRGIENQEVEAMFTRLANQGRSVNPALAGSRLFNAMIRPEVAEEELDQWSLFITRLVERPESTEPGMRFLVASALAPWHEEALGDRAERWEEFRTRLESGILRQQNPDQGFFDVRLRGSFDGGAVYDTGLCVLTLQVDQRVQQLRRAAAER